MRTPTLLAVLLLLPLGCSIENPERAAADKPAAAPAKTTKAAKKTGARAVRRLGDLPKLKRLPPKLSKSAVAQVRAARRGQAPAAATHKKGKAPIKWDGPIDWKSWDEALAASKAQKKPICLVVYADWCPRCKELAPAFTGDAELTELAKKYVMVLQDNDKRPPWLQERFGQYGGYVPRLFLLDAEGKVREDLNSGHPRYPYFYTPQGLGTLKANMRKLAEKT